MRLDLRPRLSCQLLDQGLVHLKVLGPLFASAKVYVAVDSADSQNLLGVFLGRPFLVLDHTRFIVFFILAHIVLFLIVHIFFFIVLFLLVFINLNLIVVSIASVFIHIIIVLIQSLLERLRFLIGISPFFFVSWIVSLPF